MSSRSVGARAFCGLVAVVSVASFGATATATAAAAPSPSSVTPVAVSRSVLTAPTVDEFDGFGWAVDVDGDVAVVSAPSSVVSDPPVDRARVYVYARSGSRWVLEARLRVQGLGLFAGFGNKVAVSGTTVLVAASTENTAEGGKRAGAVYVFERRGLRWTQTAKLVADSATMDDQFGTDVAIDGSTALIGSRRGSVRFEGVGTGFVFVRSGSGWEQEAELTASDGAVNDTVGNEVALSGDLAVLGAPYNAGGTDGPGGAAYIFTRTGTTWTEQVKLNSPEPELYDLFGRDVAVSDGTVVVGSPASAFLSTSPGTVYVYREVDGLWTLQNSLRPTDSRLTDGFGTNADLDGNRIVATSLDPDDAGNLATYLFTGAGGTWTQHARLPAPPEAEGVVSIAVDDGTTLIGYPRVDTAAGGENAGTVISYR